MVAVVTVTDWKLGGSVVTNVIPIFILVGFWLYFLRRAGVLTVAYEFVDDGDHLAIRMGRKQALVPFSNIAHAQIAVPIGLPGVQVTFVQPTELGKRVTFWVESKPEGEMTRVAYEISERTTRAREGRVG